MNPNEEPERTTPLPGPNARNSLARYKFTPEEEQVIKECNSESFYQRCLPFSSILGAATYYAVKTGFIGGNQRFGAAPKVTAAIIIGFFLGKFSYQQKCAEKFMALPNSKVGHYLRARKQGFLDDRDPSAVPNISLSPFSGITESYSDIPPPSSGNYDYASTPSTEGLDDSFRPSLDNPIILHEQEMPPEQKHVTTYDELRKKNREEYEQKRLAIYRQTRLPKTPASPASQPSSSNEDVELSEEYKPTTGGKTKYGDVWA